MVIFLLRMDFKTTLAQKSHPHPVIKQKPHYLIELTLKCCHCPFKCICSHSVAVQLGGCTRNRRVPESLGVAKANQTKPVCKAGFESCPSIPIWPPVFTSGDLSCRLWWQEERRRKQRQGDASSWQDTNILTLLCQHQINAQLLLPRLLVLPGLE